MDKIPVTDAVGRILGHDLTRIIPGKEKSCAFRRGHIITPADIPVLLDMGKSHIYVWEGNGDLVHEDEAALRLARYAAGPGIAWDEPNQGKVNLKATRDGLLKVQVKQLQRLNSLGEVSFASLHNNRPVVEGEVVAGTRVIPLAIAGHLLEEAEKHCHTPLHLLEVKPFRHLWVGVVTTGTEVYEGRVQDGFCHVIRQKTAPYGARILGQVIVPDDPNCISREILQMIGKGAELVLVTGGMSVDPDDVTPAGIRGTGAEIVAYGAPVLPGSMFMLAYLGHVPVAGIPGCVMFNRITIFDLILPRLFAGDLITGEEIASLGHGGFCAGCVSCHYPNCAFGKSSW